MENSQVKNIAISALTGHWPAHLGLATDGEKIEWLARQVERLVDESADADDLRRANDGLIEKVDELNQTLADAKRTLREALESL